jgi:hypothetical protein
MDREALGALFRALEMGVFERDSGGGFVSVGPLPAWMTALVSGTTFPFLGSFLEEAREFWAEPRTDALRWGPCTERDSAGQELHFTVAAVSLDVHKMLIFERDRGAETIRALLQHTRGRALAAATQPSPAAEDPTRASE